MIAFQVKQDDNQFYKLYSQFFEYFKLKQFHQTLNHLLTN